jgi:heme/copper-type cytochrome/quinol oxidase subunit 1
MMRRIYDPTVYAHLRPLQPLNVLITESAFALGIAQLLFVLNFFSSLGGWKKVIVKPLALILAAMAALAYAPVFDLFAGWITGAASPVTILGIQFMMPALSITAAMILALGIAVYLARSPLAAGAKADSNPWRANTLEWQIPSPVPAENFVEIPIVFHAPYEYSSPHDVSSDYLPQNRAFDAAPLFPEAGEPLQG